MNRSIFALLAIFTLFLAACAQAPIVAVNDTNNTPVAPLPEPQKQVLPTTNSGNSVINELPSDVQNVLRQGAGRISSGFTFTYVHTKASRTTNETVNFARVTAKDTKRKLVINQGPQIARDFVVNQVFLDSADQSAIAVCTNKPICGMTPTSRAQKYSDFNLVGPEEWAPKITSAQKIGEEQIDARYTVKIGGLVESIPTTIWVDRYSGLTVQAQQGTDVWQYTSLDLGATDADVTP